MSGRPDVEAERQQDAARLDRLEARLARAQPLPPQVNDLGGAVDQANLAWRMVVELVAGLLLGFGIGFGLDWLFGTGPVFLLIFVLAGLVAGIKTMLRTAREIGAGPPDEKA